MGLEAVWSLTGTTVEHIVVGRASKLLKFDNISPFDVWVKLGSPAPSNVPSTGTFGQYDMAIRANLSQSVPAPDGFDGSVTAAAYNPANLPNVPPSGVYSEFYLHTYLAGEEPVNVTGVFQPPPGLYVPAAGVQAFAPQAGVWYTTDAAGNPYATLLAAPPFIPAPRFVSQDLLFTTGSTAGAVTLAAPGTGMRNYVLGASLRCDPAAGVALNLVFANWSGITYQSLKTQFSTVVGADTLATGVLLPANAANAAVSLVWGLNGIASIPANLSLALWGVVIPE